MDKILKFLSVVAGHVGGKETDSTFNGMGQRSNALPILAPKRLSHFGQALRGVPQERASHLFHESAVSADTVQEVGDGIAGW